MTMPHMMNCSHSSDGWCIPCVEGQQEKIDRLVESLAALMARCNGHLGQSPYAVAEYKHALNLLAELTNTANPYDVNVFAMRNATIRD